MRHIHKMTEPSNNEFPGKFVALEYEKRIEPFTGSFVEDLMKPFVARTEGRSSTRLLDFGCGTGIVALEAAKQGYQVTATDLSPDMVERLQQRASEHITSFVADGQDMPKRLHSQFDYCVAHFSVIFFPSPVEGLRQIHSCLVPGGQVVLSAWGSPEETPAFQVVPDAFREIAPNESPQKSRITGSPQVLANLIQDAGFDNYIRIRGPVERVLHVASASAYFDRFYYSSPKIRAAMDSLPEDVFRQLKDRILELATERGGQPDGSIQLPARAYYA
jgi:SAM-dependent methyltransferase